MALEARRPLRKRRDRYHHGDLRHALIQAAVRTIQRHGVEALTLRGVGNDLAVSRTALYRHFAHKEALLAAVAREAFRKLRLALVDACERERAGGSRSGFEAMGMAYVRFAIENSSEYRIMFGGFLPRDTADPSLAEEGAAAFKVLVDSVVQQQKEGIVRADDPIRLARFIWSVVHGIAMLACDRHFPPSNVNVEELTRYAFDRIRIAIRAVMDVEADAKGCVRCEEKSSTWFHTRRGPMRWNWQ